MAQDPLWAVRWVKRAFRAFALVCALVLLGCVVWLVLPEAPPVAELNLRTNVDAFLGEQALGQGELRISDDALRSAGIVVPAGSELSAIAARLFPGEEFRGPVGVGPGALPMEAAGVECYLSGRDSRVARVWVFAIEDDQWLAVAIQFRDANGRSHTNCNRDTASFGWSVTKSLHKRRSNTMSANVMAVDGTFPAAGQIRTGPIKIR